MMTSVNGVKLMPRIQDRRTGDGDYVSASHISRPLP